MTVPAYPLQWPAGWKRTPNSERAFGRFGKKTTRYSTYTQTDGSRSSYQVKGEVTIADGVDRVRAELQRMGVSDDDLVINSNLQLRMDGFPKSAQREPDDPGIAVYWRDGKEQRCMAIDRYTRVADNLAAVAATLDAMRAIERHGGAEILNRAFTGFVALPAPEVFEWWVELGVPRVVSQVDIEAAYRRLRSIHHPDKGGDPAAFQRITRAYEEATEQRP